MTVNPFATHAYNRAELHHLRRVSARTGRQLRGVSVLLFAAALLACAVPLTLDVNHTTRIFYRGALIVFVAFSVYVEMLALLLPISAGWGGAAVTTDLLALSNLNPWRRILSRWWGSVRVMWPAFVLLAVFRWVAAYMIARYLHYYYTWWWGNRSIQWRLVRQFFYTSNFGREVCVKGDCEWVYNAIPHPTQVVMAFVFVILLSSAQLAWLSGLGTLASTMRRGTGIRVMNAIALRVVWIVLAVAIILSLDYSLQYYFEYSPRRLSFLECDPQGRGGCITSPDLVRIILQAISTWAFAFIDGGITLSSTLMRPNEPLLHLVYFYIVNVAAVSAFVILTGWVLLAARLLMIFQQKR